MRHIIPFLILILLSCSHAVNNETVIGIIPYKGITKDKVAKLQQSLEKYYGVQTRLLPQRRLPKNAFINLKFPRYRADSLIRIQQRTMPKGIDYILGLTESDISVTKLDNGGNIKKPVWKYNDFGIMGLAYCPGKSCIVSGFR